MVKTKSRAHGAKRKKNITRVDQKKRKSPEHSVTDASSEFANVVHAAVGLQKGLQKASKTIKQKILSREKKAMTQIAEASIPVKCN